MTENTWTYFRIKRNGVVEYYKTQGYLYDKVWVNEDSGNVYLSYPNLATSIPKRYPAKAYTRIPEKVANLAKIVK